MMNKKVSVTHLSLLERMADSRLRNQAWHEFVDRYSRLFFIWFGHWNIDPFEMEDVFQETLIRILGNVKYFDRRRDGSFRTWLKTLAHNTWQSLADDTERQLALRKSDPVRAQRWISLRSKMAETSLIDLFDSWATEELLNMAHSRVRRRVDQDTWSTYQQVVLEKVPVEVLTAQNLIPANTVYARIFRVRRMLKSELIAIDSPHEQGLSS